MKQLRQVVGAVLVAGVGVSGMAQTNLVAPKSWVDSITFKGDVRYRYESINDDSKLDSSKDTYTRQRDRVRARLGAEAKCNDQLKAGVALSTGQSDPVSGNQSLGDGFGKKDMKLDLAYFDYTLMEDGPTEAHAIAGKMNIPFATMPDDLVWDGDARPEGVAVKGQTGNEDLTLFANGGYLWYQERADKDDLTIYAGQAGAKYQFVPEVAFTVGASYYGFNSFKGADVVDWEAKNNGYGNSTQKGSVSGSTTNKAWAADYTPIVYFAQLDLWAAGLPIAFFAQQLSNGDADKYDQGHMYGVTVGKARNPQTWEVGYSYAELEKDATLGALTDSDRWGGGTDGKGHKFGAKYQIKKNLQIGASYFLDDKAIADASKTKDYDRLQLDLVASF
jgi:hypothetical protein